MDNKKYFRDAKTIIEVDDDNSIYKIQKSLNFSINGKNNARIYIGEDNDDSIKFNIYIRFIDDESKDSRVEIDSDDDIFYYNFINWDKIKKSYNGKDVTCMNIKKSHIANITDVDSKKVYELYIDMNIIVFDNREETKLFTVNLYTKEI